MEIDTYLKRLTVVENRFRRGAISSDRMMFELENIREDFNSSLAEPEGSAFLSD